MTGISTFSRELNEQIGYSKEYGRVPSIPININFEILILYKDQLISTLVVEEKDIDDDLLNFHDALVEEFLSKYKKNLVEFDGDVVAFNSFEDEIERIYRKMRIFSYQIPNKVNVQKRINLDHEQFEVLRFINGQNSIKEIANKMGKEVDRIKDIISVLSWNELINLSEKVNDDDIFEPKKELFHLIRSRTFNQEETPNISEKKALEFNVLNSIDGLKTVSELAEDFPNLTIKDIKYIISYYRSKGDYLEKIELYPQVILINDKILLNLPNESLALCYSLENICDGELSLLEISEKLGVSIKEIKKILEFIGKHVLYKKKYVK